MHIPLFRVIRSDGDVQVTVRASPDFDCPSIRRLPRDGNSRLYTGGHAPDSAARHNHFDFTQLLRWYK